MLRNVVSITGGIVKPSEIFYFCSYYKVVLYHA